MEECSVGLSRVRSGVVPTMVIIEIDKSETWLLVSQKVIRLNILIKVYLVTVAHVILQRGQAMEFI